MPARRRPVDPALHDLTTSFVEQLQQLVEERLLERVRAVLSATGGPPERPKAAPASPARRLQGQYLGALRGLKGAARAKVRARAKEHGVREALALARRLGR
jgi:hypothetical protein